jgi:beta-lactamase regulating signal transducer with metallopeptidase domain
MIKMSLVVLLGLVATFLLRRRSAAARHWMLAAAIVCAAATPLLERVAPVWHLPIGASFMFARAQPLALLIPVHEREVPDGDRVGEQARFVPVQPAMRTVRVLESIWLAGLLSCSSFLVIGFVRLWWLASRSQRVANPTWSALAHSLSHDFGLRRRVLLLQSDHPTLLVTWGLWRPKVILPAEARMWPEERVRIVLAHELAHIRRGDWLVQLTAELLRAIYWFNPLLWIACRQLRRESEHACDDAVLALGVEGTEYASTLLDLARAFRLHRRTFFPAPAMARPSSLERRVSAMLNRSINRTPLSRSACIATVISLIAIALPIAGLVASAQATAQFSGTLVDTVGRVLPDTTMVLTAATGTQKHQARSDQTGHFAFTGLTGGDYLLEVDRMGFAPTQGRVSLAAGQTLVQDVALQLGTLQETITVTDGPPTPTKSGGRRIQYKAEPSACSQTTIGGCIEQPMKLRDVKPVFPPQSAGSGRTVTLNFEARIGVDGFVNDLRVVTPGEPEFAAAAVQAIRQWEFSQTRLDGVPVEVKMNISVMFRSQP